MNTNQKRISKYLLYFLILNIMILCSMRPITAFASSATVGFEIEETEYVVGEQFTVTITINSEANLGNFEGSIVYNSEVLEYVDGPSCIAGGSGMLRIEDMDASSSWNVRNYIMTFKTIDVGECEFAFNDAPTVYEYESKEAMSVLSSSKSIRVNSLPETSDNAELALIKIGNYALTPTFDSSVTEYSVIVDSTTVQLVLSAIPVDAKAKVEISGNENFQAGENSVLITVVAESGASKKYVIHVSKEEQPVVTIPAAPEGEKDCNIQASVKEGKTIIQGAYEYTIVSADDSIQIPSGYVKTSIKIDGLTIPIYQLSADIEDDYLLLILQNQYGQTNLYRYDRYEKTIQRFTGDRVIIQENTDDVEQKISQIERSYNNKVGKKNLVIAILSGFVLVLVIGLITLYLKTKGIRDDEFY